MYVREGGEIPLIGGRSTPGVVRVGNTVRRPMGPNAPFVHGLLRYLEGVGFGGAPRLLGIDERGREVLSFVEGEVPHDHDGYRPSEARLIGVAALIRRFHDVTAGSELAGGAEIVAHNELGPHNTVFAGDEPVAFIDWDEAAPGARLFDLANAVWSYANVGEDGGPVGEQARLIRVMCEAYGWQDPHAIVDEIHADLLRARANHERAERPKARDIFQKMISWMEAHAGELKRLA
jgi:aminoglycoside phosphotransferase (APT) family kinase protein